MTRTRIIVALTCAALLAACESEPERAANDSRDAGGEVLEGTISDEMIQLDRLQSQGDPEEPEDAVEGSEATEPADGDVNDGGGDGAASAVPDEAGPAGTDGETATQVEPAA
ncbi:hypothetical protein [Croceicoccus sp. Ery15]|uniref:hypothetical protein n=1 Tax=Croceicoccus sp. Ery15 TaxID=1703338 RepID=UPI001E48E79E|nr:hypothetical protein [Croceicoccus sp. Ery15]